MGGGGDCSFSLVVSVADLAISIKLKDQIRTLLPKLLQCMKICNHQHSHHKIRRELLKRVIFP